MFEIGVYFVGFFGLKKLAKSWVRVSFPEIRYVLWV